MMSFHMANSLCVFHANVQDGKATLFHKPGKQTAQSKLSFSSLDVQFPDGSSTHKNRICLLNTGNSTLWKRPRRIRIPEEYMTIQ